MIHKCDLHETLRVVNSILQVKLLLTTSDAYISTQESWKPFGSKWD